MTTIELRPTLDRRGRFDAVLDGEVIVRGSSTPICDAARVLLAKGIPEESVLSTRHQGSEHIAMSGSLGAWAKVTVRDDHGAPKFRKRREDPLPTAPSPPIALRRARHSKRRAIKKNSSRRLTRSKRLLRHAR
jgi:hypothetical protein